MVIYSWNMLYRNKHPDEALDFIRNAPFDVFCLQEVPELLLERLSALPSEITFRQDMEKLFKDESVSMYNVILSKYPIRGSGEIPFPDYDPAEPFQTRIFRRIMPRHFPRLRDRGGIYADIEVHGKIMRVFNLHLIIGAQPSVRLDEFERAMAKRDPSLPSIVCGDFNTIEKPHITILNWLFGSPASDALFYQRERTTIEKRFVAHALFNPLRGHPTHGLSRSQLDHILVSKELSVESAEVIPDRRGSDHHPIRVTIEGIA